MLICSLTVFLANKSKFGSSGKFLALVSGCLFSLSVALNKLTFISSPTIFHSIKISSNITTY